MNITDLSADVNEHIDFLTSEGDRLQLRKLVDALDSLHEIAQDSLNDLGEDDGDEFEDTDEEISPPLLAETDDGDIDETGDDLGDGVDDD